MADWRPLPEFVRVEKAGRVALVHPDYREVVANALLDGTGCEDSGHYGRGALQRFAYGGGSAVLRRHLRGGFIRHFVKDLYLFVNRPLRELGVHRAAYEAGLFVPMPLGVLWERRGPFYRGAIASTEVESIHLHAFLEHPKDNRNEVLEACGNAIRQMHDAGIVHADLQIRNILLKEGQPYLIDFDNARRRTKVSLRERQKNLERLRRSFRKTGVSDDDFLTLKKGYGHASSST